MLFKYLVLSWGLLECCLGAFISLKKDLLMLNPIVESLSFFIKDFNITNIKDKKIFSTWIGDMILVEGALYAFLGSSSLYFQMNNIIILCFIIIIEILFFNILLKGVKKNIN